MRSIRHLTLSMSQEESGPLRIWARMSTPCKDHGQHAMIAELSVEQPHQVDPWSWVSDTMAAAYDVVCGCAPWREDDGVVVERTVVDRCDGK